MTDTASKASDLECYATREDGKHVAGPGHQCIPRYRYEAPRPERELVYPLDANVSTAAICVRCGGRKVQVAVRAPNGSKDAICLECVQGPTEPRPDAQKGR